MTEKEHKAERIDLKALVGGDRDFLRQLIRATLQEVQEVLEAEMTDALGAAKGERTTGRNGYRSGYAPRQSFLFVATSIFVGCRQVKRSLPSDKIEGGHCDTQIWPTPGSHSFLRRDCNCLVFSLVRVRRRAQRVPCAISATNALHHHRLHRINLRSHRQLRRAGQYRCADVFGS